MGQNRASALSLRANFTWTFFGNVIYSGCQWAMLVALAKLGSTTMVGYFALGLAVTAPVLMLTNLQLRGLQATDSNRQYMFGHYFGLRLLTTPLALGIILGIAVASGYGHQESLVVVAVGLAKSFESISDVLYGLVQQHERMDRIAKSMIIKGILSLVALAATVHLTHSILWGTLALAAAWACILVTYDTRSGVLVLSRTDQTPSTGFSVPSFRRGLPHSLRPIWDLHHLIRLAWLALPIGIVTMLSSLTLNTPRYIIEHELGANQLGIFAAMAYVLVAGTTVINALGQATSPRLSHYYAAGDVAACRDLLLKLLGIGVVMGAGGVVIALVAGREILTVMYRPEYATHVDVFIWLLVAAALDYLASLLGYGLTMARYLKIQVPIVVTALVVMAIGSVLLIPAHGLLGAAWATCSAFAVLLALNGYAMSHALRRRARDAHHT